MAKTIIPGAAAPEIAPKGALPPENPPLPKQFIDLIFDATVEIECLVWLHRQQFVNLTAGEYDEGDSYFAGNALDSMARRIGQLNSAIMSIVTERVEVLDFDELYFAVNQAKAPKEEEVAA